MRCAPHSALICRQGTPQTFSVYDLKNVQVQLAAEAVDEELLEVLLGPDGKQQPRAGSSSPILPHPQQAQLARSCRG